MACFELHLGDCLEVLKTMPDSSVDAVVCDPPYGLSFMGKRWDYDVPSVEVWAECLRVLKPGGHLLAFAGTRTQHRMAVRVEDAGFEIRDMIAWVYASGFPKSLDVSKAIDKAAGAVREVIGQRTTGIGTGGGSTPVMGDGNRDITAPDAARQWQGWGTALKPALEPITVARKPLSEGTVAANVLAHGTGALNIDGCRVDGPGGVKWETPRGGIWSTDSEATARLVQNEQGRWPANLIHDGSDEVLAGFPTDSKKATGEVKVSSGKKSGAGTWAGSGMQRAGAENTGVRDFGDTGSAARFFYCAKASKADRGADNVHPTVKPTDLMAYLCRLVTPPGGVVLDPFMGSGSTGKAAVREGFRFIGIEREAEYLEIARARISAVAPEVPSVDDLI